MILIFQQHQMAKYTPLFAYQHSTTLFQPPPTLFHPRLHNFIRNSTSSPAENKLSVYLSKRLLLNLSISTLLISSSSSSIVIAAEEEPELIRYTDSLEGFTFLRPSSYIKVPTTLSYYIWLRLHAKRLLRLTIPRLFINLS